MANINGDSARSSPIASHSLRFQPVDTKSVVEHNELVRQRRLCGWGEPDIESWKKLIDSGDRLMYWVFADGLDLPEIEEHNFILPDESNLELPPRDTSFLPVGHIAMDWLDYFDDSTLCDKSRGIITVATLFVLLSQQGKGLGRRIMDIAEQKAKDECGCKTITLNTRPPEEMTDLKYLTMIGMENDYNDGLLNGKWYERRGYERYKKEPRYPFTTRDGRNILLNAIVR